MKKNIWIILLASTAMALVGCAKKSSPVSGSTSAETDTATATTLPSTETSVDVTPKKFTVTFLNYDSSLLGKAEVEKGGTAAYDEAKFGTPSRTKEDKYYYVWTGWDAKLDNVVGNYSTKATYDRKINKYTVTFYDEDGTTTLDTEEVEYGATATFNGATPNKDQDEAHTYVFDKWDGSLTNITKDTSVKAVYKAAARKYTVTFNNWDDTLIGTTEVEYGQPATYSYPTPVRAQDVQYSYVWSGWDQSIDAVKENLTVKATFTNEARKYTVTFLDAKGQPFGTAQEIAYNEAATAPNTNPTKEPTNTTAYTFKGWDQAFDHVTSNLTINPLYNEAERLYSVRFVIEGTEVTTVTVRYGETAVYPKADPTKEKTNTDIYTFTGWDGTLTNITEDKTVNAVFASTTRTYTVTFAYDGDDDTKTWSTQVPYNGTAVYAGPAPTKAMTNYRVYSFDEWDTSLENITGDTTVTADFTYSARYYTVTFKDYDGTVLYQDNKVEYHNHTSYKGAKLFGPANQSGVSHEFGYWARSDSSTQYGFSDIINAIAQDTTLTATYTNATYELTYENMGTYAQVSGCTAGSVLGNGPEIATSYQSLPVTTIKDNAFQSNLTLTAIKIPDTITTIGVSAFQNCKNLRSLDLGKGVVTIGESAFDSAWIEKSITLPKSLTSLGKNAFQHTYLETFDYEDENNVNITNWGFGVFEGSYKLTNVNLIIPSTAIMDGFTFAYSHTSFTATVHYQGTALPEYMFIESDLTKLLLDAPSITAIPKGFCTSCFDLTSINIPANVTSIGENAFMSCAALASVTLPNALTTIGLGAFQYSGLTSMTIPSSVTTIKDYAFDSTGKMTAFTVGEASTSFLAPDGVLYSHDLTTLYEYPAAKTDVAYSIKEGCTKIRVRAFSRADNLTLVKLPSTLTVLDVNALSGASNLATIQGLEQITAYYNYCLSGTAITSFTANAGITSIPDRMFDSCAQLTSVTLNTTITQIGSGAFQSCRGLTSIDWSGATALTTIADGAFYYCSGLTSVKMPASLTVLRDNAFHDCTGLTNLDFSTTGLTTVQLSCFHDMRALTSIKFPETFSSLGAAAFGGDSALTSVTLPTTKAGFTIGDQAFFGAYNLQSLIIPEGTTGISAGSFGYCSKAAPTIMLYFRDTVLPTLPTDWDKIDDTLTARHALYSATKPTSDWGNYWHLVSGVPAVWTETDA
jgi:hypothetical protein